MSGWQTKVINILVNFLPVCIFHIWNEHSGMEKKKARTPVECTYLSTGNWVLPITIFQHHSCGFCLNNRIGIRICPVSAIFVTANGWQVNRAGGNCSHRHSTLSGLGSLSLVSHHSHPNLNPWVKRAHLSARLPLKSTNQRTPPPFHSLKHM